MNRRRYLASAALGVAGGLGGCLGLDRLGEGPVNDGTGSPVAASSTAGTSVARVGDVTLPISTAEMRSAVPRDYIPAIESPSFAESWEGLTLPEDSMGESTTLPESDAVIGVTHDGRARAYPLRVLNWHEVVNDDFGGPLLVTYCVLCGSAVVADRLVDGTATLFGVSGYLWRRDLVLYDRATDSLWSQLLATAINGPATGEQLSLRPATLTSWGEWQKAHPDTEVLLPPPASDPVDGYDRTFDYFSSKYGFGEQPPLIGYDSHDGDVHPQTFVIGITHDDHARAYLYDAIAEQELLNDTIGSLPVVVTVAPGETLVAYDRRVDGTTLRFSPDEDANAFMQAGGSRWERSSGRAVAGPYEGTELTRANDLPPMFWTGWVNFHPDSTVHTQSGLQTPEPTDT